MKMRQFKRAKLVGMFYALWGPWGPIGQWLTRPVVEAREEAVLPVVVHPFIAEPGVVLKAEEAVFYTVKRAKDDVVVLTTSDIDEAVALMDKHHRQKKAKLLVFRNDGEPVLFIDGVPA